MNRPEQIAANLKQVNENIVRARVTRIFNVQRRGAVRARVCKAAAVDEQHGAAHDLLKSLHTFANLLHNSCHIYAARLTQ